VISSIEFSLLFITMLVKVCERNFPLFDIYPLRISSRKNSKKTQKDKNTHTHTHKKVRNYLMLLLYRGSGGEEKIKK
jgi:uncharacterized membrane protein